MAHAENRLASRAGAHRRAAALGCLLLIGSLALTGCSSKDSKPDVKASANGASSAGKPTSAFSTAVTASSTAGTAMMTSLSDAQLGYIVTAIPTDLDVKWVAILQDFVAYDQMSWKLWVGGGQDTDKVPTVTTGNPQRQLINDAVTLQSMGRKAKAPVKAAISEVAMSADGQSTTASYCVDITQVTCIDAQGRGVTEPSNKVCTPVRSTMVPGSNGHWLASEGEEAGELSTCKVG